jgi:ABC-type glutathione transport system ATPase component
MAPPLLDAHALSKTFTTGRGDSRRVVRAVQEVDLAVEAGQTHGLVGESGSGKTTLARILLRLIEPDAGTVTFRGQALLRLRGGELRQIRRHIQLVHQDPFSSVDPRFSVRDIVAEPWDIHGLYDHDERRRRADGLIERVGIDPALGARRPASFSGGQLQRIGIARALALEPELIICDEPVSALDVSVQRQILNLLLDLQQERGVSYLLIAHDLAVVGHMSDRVSVMQEGRIVESGLRDDVFEHSSHPYTRALLGAVAPSAPDAGVDRDDGDVSQQVDKSDEQSGDDADAHDERRVQPPETQEKVRAEARHRENHLDHSHAREEAGEVERQDRQQRQEGVGQEVPPAY